MGKPFRCKLGNHSYKLMDKNFVKTCVFCGHKFDPNNKTRYESMSTEAKKWDPRYGVEGGP